MKVLPALRRQQQQPAAAGDGQRPTQPTPCVIFTPALSHRVLWGEKLEGALRKISIGMTTVLSTIALILCGVSKHSIHHFCPSPSILLLIRRQLNSALGSRKGSTTEGKSHGLCTAAVSNIAGYIKILPMKCMRKEAAPGQLLSSLLLSSLFFSLYLRSQRICVLWK